MFPTRDGNRNHCTGDLIRHIGLAFRKVVYSSYDVPSETFRRKFLVNYFHYEGLLLSSDLFDTSDRSSWFKQ